MHKIERVARAMCQAKGLDPDTDSGKGPMEVVTSGSSMSTSYTQQRRPHPNWRLYEADATVFVAAHEALMLEADCAMGAT